MLLAQLTDTHVMRAGITRRRMGDTLAHVVRAARWLEMRSPRPDAVVVTGDLVDGADPLEYERLAGAFAASSVPWYLVPGNHDRAGPLRAAFPAHAYLPQDGRLNYAIGRHPARIIGIDSTERGRAGGSVDAATLAWLDQTLAEEPMRPTALCLHHPPFRTGMHYMDAFGFVGLERLREVIAKHEQVRLVMSGHVHRAFRTLLGRATLWTSSSTAPQVVPELFERVPFWIRFERPGLSLHAWDEPTGSFDSRLFVADHDGGYVEAPRSVSVPPAG